MSTPEDREQDAHEDAIADDQDEANVCPRCWGDGSVFGPTPGWSGAPWEYKCDTCNGTGRIDPDDYDEPYFEPQSSFL